MRKSRSFESNKPFFLHSLTQASLRAALLLVGEDEDYPLKNLINSSMSMTSIMGKDVLLRIS